MKKECQYYGAHGSRNIKTMTIKDISEFINIFDSMKEGEEKSIFLYLSSKFIKRIGIVLTFRKTGSNIAVGNLNKNERFEIEIFRSKTSVIAEVHIH